MVKITKKQRLLSVRNSWNCADYWLVHGRIYNDAGTAYYRFKFVLSVDLELDLWDCETETEIPYNTALEEMIFSFTDRAAGAFDNDAARVEFFQECNDSIRFWNDCVHSHKRIA